MYKYILEARPRTSRILIGLLVATLLVSVAYSFAYHVVPSVDAGAYDKIAWNLAQGRGYTEDASLKDNPTADDAIVRVGPGYEFFLAGAYRLFGHHVEIVWVLHAILRALTAFIVFLIASLLFKRDDISLFAVALFGFSPDFILINGLLLTETLLLALFLGAVYVSLRTLQTESARATFYASLLWGSAALVRPTVLLAFIVFVVAWLVVRRARLALLSLLFPVILLGGWSLHNSLLYSTPLFTTTAGSYDLWVGNNPDARGGFEKTPEIQAVRDVTHSVPLAKIAQKKYFEFMFGHPLQFTELQFRKASIYFSFIRPTGFWSFLQTHTVQQVVTIVLSALWSAFILLFGITGLVALWKKYRDRVTRTFVLFAVIQPIAVIPLIVESRYRYAFLSLLVISAAYALYNIRKLQSAFTWVFIVLLFFTSYDLVSNSGDVLAHIQKIL